MTLHLHPAAIADRRDRMAAFAMDAEPLIRDLERSAKIADWLDEQLDKERHDGLPTDETEDLLRFAVGKTLEMASALRANFDAA